MVGRRLWIPATAFFVVPSAAACNAILDFEAATLAPPSASSSGGQGGASSGGAGPGGSGAEPAWLTGYGWRRPVTIHADQYSEDLTDFVLGIVLDDDSHLALHAQESAADIVVTASDGTTLLNHEIELFDHDTGRLATWVRVPRLPASNDSVLWLYYGNPSATEPTSADVWHAAFHGVWHLSSDLSLPTDDVEDSSSFGNHGVHGGVNVTPSRLSGLAGDGYEFDSSDYVSFGDPPDGSLDFGTDSFSISLWVHEIAAQSATDQAWVKGDSTGPNYSIDLGMHAWSFFLDDGTSAERAAFGSEFEFEDYWTHLVAVVDRAEQEARVYANGNHKQSVEIGHLESLSNEGDARLGGVTPFVGIIDEVRVYGIAVSPAWIAAEYANLAPARTLVTVGTAEAPDE